MVRCSFHEIANPPELLLTDLPAPNTGRSPTMHTTLGVGRGVVLPAFWEDGEVHWIAELQKGSAVAVGWERNGWDGAGRSRKMGLEAVETWGRTQ